MGQLYSLAKEPAHQKSAKVKRNSSRRRLTGKEKVAGEEERKEEAGTGLPC